MDSIPEIKLDGAASSLTFTPAMEGGSFQIPPAKPAVGIAPAETNGGRNQPESDPGADKRKSERIRKWKKRHPGQRHPDESPAVVETDTKPLPAMEVPDSVPVEETGGGVDSDPDFEVLQMVDWTAADIAEITDDGIELLETWDMAGASRKAKLANLPPDLVAEMEASAKMPKLVKKIFKLYPPALIAKKLNAAKMSAENKEGSFMILGLLLYLWHKLSLVRRQNALCKAANPALRGPAGGVAKAAA